MRAIPGLFLALVLVGCTGAGGQAPGRVTPAETPDPPTGPAAEATVRSSMSQDELAEALRNAPPGPPRSNEEMLAQFWETTGIEGPPPTAEPVRTVDLDETDAVELACMAEQGFPSRVDQFGQEGIEFSRGQEDDLARATYTCMAMYPIDEKYLRAFSLDQLRALYDWRTTETIPCMVADGVTPPEPPSFDTLVGEYAATGYRHWSPRSGVEPPPEIAQDLERSMAWCPDTPPDDVLYGQP